jgi:hypothetical protein
VSDDTSTEATMQTGDIQRRIGLAGVTEALLTELGFKPAGTDKRARLWKQSDYPSMCEKIGNWVKAQAKNPMQPKPARPVKAAKAAAATPPAVKLAGGMPVDPDDF